MSGRAGSSVRRWWYQRLSAVALLPLSLWLIYECSMLTSLDYAVVRAWLATPATTILFILLLPALYYHALLGLEEVLEDYIADTGKKHTAITLTRLLVTLGAGAALLAVLLVNLGV
ncbi:MAG: succinate dehydrogenase, hydrophobic membrane anchor protein [Gammaproteobacteria bacterium]|nr:succinate dehydrogenase, hydrophobic membrane anchor protein [Gammaproteobacteria bacterium]MCY4211677.1 succinate dehydrogenase, hydrophobic membrane anchor protein [Gammaproteobacteria bacterium]MCY4281937.1 succinate dehydrogenase, hydrophobic membrane anchor protein [Gammaproteobacteria bacterium]MCY4338693.1 succinate dehydrogenase, hydrophobic membrane anchor protein [Gammaproteobacteria bacterium]